MKRSLAVLVALVMVFAVVQLPVTAANMEFIYYTNDGSVFSEGGWAGGSALKGYNATETIYGHTDAETSYFGWKPALVFGGKYRVYTWNVPHETNASKMLVEIQHKNGTANVEYAHKNVEAGWVDLGEYEFNAGEGAVFTFRRSGDGKFGRLNCLKLELIEKGDSTFEVDLPEITEDYPDYAVRDLPVRDVSLPEIKENAVKIYAAPNGNGDGSEGSPCSLEEAQRKVEELVAGGYPADGIGVYLNAGTYQLSDTFTITGSGSGTEESPVIWQAYNGEVTFTSGKVIENSLPQLVTDQQILDKLPAEGKGHVYAVDLGQLGVTELEPITSIADAYILTIGGELGNMSQWPNEGYAYTGNTTDMASRNDSGPRKKGFTYEIADPRTLRWGDSVGDSWLMGYFLTDYDLMAMKLANVNPLNMTLSGKNNTVYGSYNNGRFYVMNLLEEIDSPGEWYVDSDTKTLYFYPTDGWENKEIKLALDSFDGVSFEGASNVVLKGISIDTLRGVGVRFDSSTSNCMFAGGKIINVASVGASINGSHNTVRDCDIAYTGAKGAQIDGGEIRTLTQAQNRLENNIIHDVGVSSNQKSGVGFNGCGQIIVNNHLYNIPMTGMGGSGVEHTIDYNIFERTCLENSDTASVYYNNEGPGHGTTMNYNIVRDPVGLNHHMAAGLYIDNGTSGVTLKGNIIVGCNWGGLMFHCGRENTAINNIFIDCTLPVRMMGGKLGGNGADLGGMVDLSIKRNFADQEPYITKYPRYANVYEDEFYYTKYNVVKNNVMYNSGASELDGTQNAGEAVNNIDIAEFKGDKLHLNDIDYAEIKAQIPDFEEIPVDQIGPYTGGARTSTQDIIFDNRAREFHLGYPANGATNVDINTELRWTTENGGIEQYTVYLAEDPEFTKIVSMGYATKASFDTFLDYGKTYYWRVIEKPYKGYPDRWNSGGAYSFTTISLEDKFNSELELVNYLAEVTGETDNYKTQIDQAAAEVSAGSISSLEDIKEEILAKQSLSKEKMSIQIYDDFSTDVLDERPLNLYMRSSYAVDVTAQLDPMNSKNQVARLKDDIDNYYQAADRYFNTQDTYLEAGAKVYAEQTDACFTMAVRQTGSVTFGAGANSGVGPAVVFARDGKIYGDRDKTVELMPYQAGRWYDIKIIYRVDEKTYDVYIDDTLMAENIPNADQSINSVYMITFSTTEGMTPLEASKGTFYLDDVIVKTPVSTGKNPYLSEIKVDGQKLPDFEPGKMFYQTSGNLDTLEYTAYDPNANFKMVKGNNGVAILVVSENKRYAEAYFVGN